MNAVSRKKGSKPRSRGSKEYLTNMGLKPGDDLLTPILPNSSSPSFMIFMASLSNIRSIRANELLPQIAKLWKNSARIFMSYPLSTAYLPFEILLKSSLSSLRKSVLTDECELHITSLVLRPGDGAVHLTYMEKEQTFR